MRIGVRLPQYASSWHELRDTAVRCEQLGFDGLWVNDHLQAPGRLRRDATFEAFTSLAGVAQHTSRCRLGVAVLSASYRHPALVAKSAGVVSSMAPDRLVVGLGTGSDRAEHRAYGFAFPPRHERSARLAETLAVMRAMFASPEGAVLPGLLDDAPNMPAASPPIWLAAHRPGLLAVAGREGDGVIAAFVDPAEFARRRELAEMARAQAGRPALAYCLYTYVLPLTAESDTWLRAQAEALGTTTAALRRWLATTGIVAPADEMADRLAAFAAVGATDAVLCMNDRMPSEAWHALAEAVL